MAKNWCPVTVWAKFHCGVLGVFPEKKIGWPTARPTELVKGRNNNSKAHRARLTEELGRLLKALNYYPGRPTHSRITHCCHCSVVCETRVQDASKIKQGHPTHECTLETKVLPPTVGFFKYHLSIKLLRTHL